MKKKDSHSQRKLRLLAVRNLLIVLVSLCALMGVAELVLNLQPLSAGDADNENAVLMSYEKTPVPALLTTEENYVYAKQFFSNPDDYDRFVEEEAPSALRYPYIDNLKTTADYDDDTVNILVLGDSFTWGEASLNRNELFWRQMERMLRAQGYNVRVSAVAAEGATGYEELHWLVDGAAEDFSADLVIFGYVFNDAMRPGNGFGAMPQRLVIPSLTWLEKTLPRFAQKVYAYVDAKTLYTKKYGDRYKDSYISVLDDDLTPYYREHFVEPLAAYSKERDLPAVVVTLPNETNSLLLEELYRPLEDIFEGTGIGYYNSCEAFKKQYGANQHKKNITVNAMNVHPGSAAHRFYAEYICDFLLRDYADVLGQSSGTDLNSRIVSVNDRMPGDIDLRTVSESETGSVCTFVYPDITVPRYMYEVEISPYCLRNPIKEGYIKLSFENPVNLSEVRIEGEAGQQVSLWYTTVNEKLGYDDNTVTPWEATPEAPFVWRSEKEEQVTSLCIHAERPGLLTVTVTGKVEA